LEDINHVLQKKDERERLGYVPVAPWQQQGANTNNESQVNPAASPAGTEAGGEEEQNLSFSIADYLKQNHPYSEEAMKKKEEETARRKKRDAVIAAIGDGLNAFHQAYAYSRGIKPLTENKSQSKAVRDKYDELFDELDTKKRAYLREKMNAMQLDQRQQNWLDEMQFRREQAQKAKEERERKEKQAQDNWQENFDAGQKDKEERRNIMKEHYERQDRNAANRNANSGKKGSDKKPASSGKSGKGKSGASGFSIHNNEKDKTKSAKGGFSIHR